ncbi:hypothetical protein [Streptomyces cylindrosporus]|uniref:Serine/threonine protein kinase n=1 Tax=Streptomyces cylindrosporus TaxID=2927583 RepID=A0ABS9YLM1_9ACTN|nr:hypothetical protein [Streptomyces cylindrosporus]MCI3278165.1 hypothetical protein [Streptomyces cylindrosporus]
MSYPPHDFDQSAVPPGGAARARDRGVARVRGLTRWIVVAAAAGGAALGTVYTHVLPGSSASPAPAHTPAVPSSSSPQAAQRSGEDDQGGEEGDDGGARPALQLPAQPPAPTQQPPQATTGAS